MTDCSTHKPVDFYSRELDSIRRMTRHREVAIAGAMEFCDDVGLPPPRWLVSEATELLIDLLKRERPRKRGRTAGAIARFRQDMMHLERWDAVEAIRSMRARHRKELKLHRKYRHLRERGLEWVEKTLSWTRGDREREYECAAMYLNGRSARIGADAMKASHRWVKRNHAAVSQLHIFEDRFYRKIGMEGLFDRKPGTNILRLFDLKY